MALVAAMGVMSRAEYRIAIIRDNWIAHDGNNKEAMRYQNENAHERRKESQSNQED
jgi:hypothetical protein